MLQKWMHWTFERLFVCISYYCQNAELMENPLNFIFLFFHLPSKLLPMLRTNFQKKKGKKGGGLSRLSGFSPHLQDFFYIGRKQFLIPWPNFCMDLDAFWQSCWVKTNLLLTYDKTIGMAYQLDWTNLWTWYFVPVFLQSSRRVDNVFKSNFWSAGRVEMYIGLTVSVHKVWQTCLIRRVTGKQTLTSSLLPT